MHPSRFVFRSCGPGIDIGYSDAPGSTILAFQTTRASGIFRRIGDNNPEQNIYYELRAGQNAGENRNQPHGCRRHAVFLGDSAAHSRYDPVLSGTIHFQILREAETLGYILPPYRA